MEGAREAEGRSRLLICTQAIDLDDPYLSFFHRWVEEFAKHYRSVEVVALRIGRHELPANVRVHPLGGAPRGAPPRGFRRIGYRLRIVARFLSLAWRLRHCYDSVFVHMNPEFLAIAGPLWRTLGKRVGLWYVHRSTPLPLFLALVWTHRVFSSVPESFRIPTSKVRFLGHAIDVEPWLRAGAQRQPRAAGSPLRLVAVGRVSPIKRLELPIRALARAMSQGTRATLAIVGGATTKADAAYHQEIVALARQLGVEQCIHFGGALAYQQLPARLARADVAVNAAPSGGVDKAGIEALVAGLPLIASNTGYRSMLGDHPWLLLAEDEESFARHIKKLASLTPEQLLRLGESAQTSTVQRVALPRLIEQLCTELSGRCQ